MQIQNQKIPRVFHLHKNTFIYFLVQWGENKNFVIEKRKKEKPASAQGRRTDLRVQFGIALKLKNDKKNSWQRGNKTAAKESTEEGELLGLIFAGYVSLAS